MKTNTSYIHEYDILDDINECVNITIDSANSAYYSYEAALRHADLLGFFENASDSEVFMEKEKIVDQCDRSFFGVVTSMCLDGNTLYVGKGNFIFIYLPSFN